MQQHKLASFGNGRTSFDDGRPPRFMAGDFNFRIGTLEVFQVLEKAGFRDIQGHCRGKMGATSPSNMQREVWERLLFPVTRTSISAGGSGGR